MGNNPDWVFYHHDGPTGAEVMPRLLAEFPGFGPRWEKHLEFWGGEPALIAIFPNSREKTGTKSAGSRIQFSSPWMISFVRVRATH